MISSNEMKKLEDLSAEAGVSKLTLMNNAGHKVAEAVMGLGGEQGLAGKKILVVCYHGNNGGDGFVAAKYLAPRCRVKILFIGDEAKLKDEALHYYVELRREMEHLFVTLEDIKSFSDFDIIIDAIFGTGMITGIKPEIAKIIEKINDSDAIVVSVDMPSGIDSDTGRRENVFVQASLIVTFHDLKLGMAGLKEKIIVADIGIPKDVVKQVSQKTNSLTKEKKDSSVDDSDD